MRSIAAGIALGISLASCFIKPERPDASGGGDAGSDGSNVPLCADGRPATLFDDFSGSGSACGQGSAMTSNMMLQRSNGQLQFVPMAGQSGYASCRFPITANDTMVQWAGLTSDASFDVATVALVAADGFTVQLKLENPSVLRGYESTSCIPLGMRAWTPAPAWWRMTAIGSDVVADASDDGRQWFQVAKGTDAHIFQVSMIIVGYLNDAADQKTVAADAIYTCP